MADRLSHSLGFYVNAYRGLHNCFQRTRDLSLVGLKRSNNNDKDKLRGRREADQKTTWRYFRRHPLPSVELDRSPSFRRQGECHRSFLLTGFEGMNVPSRYVHGAIK